MSIPWNHLSSSAQLEEIRLKSQVQPCIIFKHSTRCSISSIAEQRLNNTESPSTKAHYYFLDLLSYRPLSNAIAELFEVEHESPQVLLISKGNCVFDESHLGIDAAELQEQIALLVNS